jgi:cytochrome b561
MTALQTTKKYAPITIAVHWLTLLFMIAIYASIELHEALPRGNPWRGATEDWHIYLGFTVMVLALVRLIINLQLKVPPITPQPPAWQMVINKGMKVYLYGLMLVAPVFGWLYLSANDEAIKWFFISVPAIAPVSESIAEFAGEAHELLGVSGYFLIGIHAAAGLYHHYWVKDDTLRRMLPAFLSR